MANNTVQLGGPSAGRNGVITEIGTTAWTGVNIAYIQVLADAVFSTFTESNAVSGSDAMTGFTVPAGTILAGTITAFTLTSGKVRAYLQAS